MSTPRGTRVEYSKGAERDLDRLPAKTRNRIVLKVAYFARQDDPLRFAKRLKPPLHDRWRFRIGEYRVVFQIGEDGEIRLLLILKVGHRKEVYE